jgi:hypothetical protein
MSTEGLGGGGISHCCPQCLGSGRRLVPRARVVRQFPNQLGTGLVEEDCQVCKGRGWFGPRGEPQPEDGAED